MKVGTNGVQINYEVEGDGPWITLSHSLACNLHMWDEQAAVLARHFKVLRFDTRGHGRSDAPAGPYSLEMLADDLKGLFDALGVRSTHFVGLSMGGMIGQVFALKYPGMLSTLVLADTTSRYPAEAAGVWADRIKVAETKGMEPLVQPTLERWFTEPFRKSNPGKVQRIAEMIRTTPVPGYVGCSHAIPKINVSARLRELDAPAKVIVGEQDMGTPVAMAREIHESYPGSELLIIPSAAHLANVEQPEAFNAALADFLAKHR
ncbi:MAG: 3-oxoadipate enol-lactonase [Burkholderiales bacterium]|nr:3-oxoadipate enol-lactonase [Burkholderiales bacterium]